jgi:hypothetical protein
MPRKSAAALMTSQIGERPRLQPPSIGVSTRERQIFRDIVGSVKPEHFAAEDSPLIALLARGLSQCETAGREIASGSTDRFWLDLQNSGLKVVDVLTRKLRLGALSRAPHNQRTPGGTALSATSTLPLPRASNPSLRMVPDTDGSSERSFAALREVRDRQRGAISLEFGTGALEAIVTLTAFEASDGTGSAVTEPALPLRSPVVRANEKGRAASHLSRVGRVAGSAMLVSARCSSAACLASPLVAPAKPDRCAAKHFLTPDVSAFLRMRSEAR